MTDPKSTYETIEEVVSTVLIGNENVVEHLTISLLTCGHVLLEGPPGVAKTTIANLFARTTGLSYNRVQMTPDLLPADITGSYVYREGEEEFQLNRGPIFANVVVADEINRATPKTQSAFLEAMEERRVTIENETLELPRPFMVIATQNPIEMEGTFELPEAQRDRFQQKLTVGLPNATEERELLDRFDAEPNLGAEDVSQTVTPDELESAREVVSDVYVDPSVKKYIQEVMAAVRESEAIAFGGSPRATLAFLDTAKARAAIHGRTYVIPDDVNALATPILSHRLVLRSDFELRETTTEEILEDVLASVEPPGTVSTGEAERQVSTEEGGSEDTPGEGETKSETVTTAPDGAGVPPDDS